MATLKDGTPDGCLIVVDPSGQCFSPAPVATLQAALENWTHWSARLADIRQFPMPLEPSQLAAPLPRAWQWLDGSAFESHGALMAKAFNRKDEPRERPLMYQGLSDRFIGPLDDVEFMDESLGIDFEGEFGVITDAVPMGTSPPEALNHIRLLVQINDWSLRTLAPLEMKTGFGFVQAKPACSMAPFAITPDEIGPAWREGRTALDLRVDWNGQRFGSPNGGAMGFGFPELVAHAARTRDLVAGTVIGSGTVSNDSWREVGSTCIAERRGIEIIDSGEPRTAYMHFGDRVRMEAVSADGRAPFGIIDQRVVRR